MKDFRTCMKGLRALLRVLRWRVAVTVLIGLVRIAASLAFVWICKRLIDIATGTLDAPIGANVGILAGILIVQILSNVADGWWESYITVEAQNRFRKEYFAHVLGSAWSGREAPPSPCCPRSWPTAPAPPAFCGSPAACGRSPRP